MENYTPSLGIIGDASPLRSFVWAVCLSVVGCVSTTWESQAWESYRIDLSNLATQKTISLSSASKPKKPITSKCDNVFWTQNITIPKKGSIQVAYPAGSFSPEKSETVGGFWAICSPDVLVQTNHVKLSYTLGFAENFDFVKWGKLPWLCGGSCPRGGKAETEGFSTRFMWRRKGDLEVYGYFPWVTEQSIERGMFRFEAGKTYQIAQEIQVNTPGQNDGVIRVFIDGKLIYEDSSLLFRNSSDTHPNRLFFSTFFWGGDKSWVTPVDTSITIWDVTIETLDK